MSELSDFELRSQEIGALPIVNHFLSRLGFAELLRDYLPVPDVRAKLQPVESLGVLVRNLILAREPLYCQGEWAERKVPELLGLRPEQVALINDDRIGRALDRLFDADRSALLTDFVLHMVQEFNVDLEQFHNDSSTITLQGEYKDADGRSVRGKPTVVATFGHNKDRSPDLKQLLWILTVSADHAIPVHFKVSNGNTEDTTTHIETWNLLCKLVGHPKFLYVADCKLCTRENLRHINKEQGWFITILPRSRKEDGLFRDWLQTNTPDWVEIARKPHPRLVDGPAEVLMAIESPIPDADGFRIIWVFSSEKKERDFLARKGCMERAWKELDELRTRLEGARCRYKTTEGVAKVADEIIAGSGAGRWVNYQIERVEEATFRQEKRGRSGKNTRWRRTTKPQFRLVVAGNLENIEYDARCDGIFPLITNRKSKDLSQLEVLDAYKSKQPMIEQRHDLLKNVLDVMPVFLKSISRLEALLFVQYVALTVHALIERELRKTMASRDIDQLSLYPEKRRCKAPTTDRVLEIFAHLQCHRLSRDGTTVQTFEPELTWMQQKVLQLLSVPTTSFGLA
jgi:transposase